ncbi:hypothetical protein P171DRAFT_347695 [Karstenula rhodostoma CBS 690.94]|uniref:F-box domain-containing protein n=1 Tax=Karstenula rhodostoma CBS 690.94 TaxID=1392251 RepID=A0A9P4UH13_9PLEO|nr:hypothetical protein P171DRAFT_347695 [Karstenula rhodostoma CBS 690.94]
MSIYILPYPHPVLEESIMVMRAARWLSRQLTRLVRYLHPSPGLGALALPPELIFIIAGYLDTPSAVSLSLTSRTMYTLCFSTMPHMDPKGKEELLLWLEKDNGTLYFCHYCTKIHQWNARWGDSNYLRNRGDLPCWEHARNGCICFPIICDITYHHARLIMNRHFYGSIHGLPLSTLRKHCRSYSPIFKVKYAETLQACISDDQLLALATRTISQSRTTARSLRHYIDSQGGWICNHLAINKGNGYNIVQLPELTAGRNTPIHFAPCDTSFGSCPECFTDYDIDITWGGEKGGFVIKIAVYGQLGQCRSPFDWSWLAMTRQRVEGRPRIVRSQDYGPGLVRDRWNRAGGIGSERQGAWVEVPSLRRHLERSGGL